MEWNWPMLDEGRIKRAKSVKFTSLDAASASPSGRAAGSGAEDYTVALQSCTCADFSISQRKGQPTPCKHMIALAMKAGILTENGLTPAQQKAADIQSLKDQIAMAYGYYHHFHEPAIPDTIYDDLCQKYNALLSDETM